MASKKTQLLRSASTPITRRTKKGDFENSSNSALPNACCGFGYYYTLRRLIFDLFSKPSGWDKIDDKQTIMLNCSMVGEKCFDDSIKL